MRDIVITQNITVDGVVEATDDWFTITGLDAEADAVYAAQRDASDGFLVGRSTFEGMRESWGRMDDDPTGTADHLNAVRKYVVSTTLTDPGWTNSEVLSGPLAREIARITAQPGSDIVCTGSISLCHSLAAEDLVDEYRLWVHPFARGSGRRLFDGTLPRHLRLVESTAYGNGIVQQRYRTR